MVWACITHKGKGLLTFIEEGVKINHEIYVRLLEDEMLPWAKDTFGWDEEEEAFLEDWCFQQDSAPSHRARQTQAWLQVNVPDWITPQQWPPYSPDENGLDYSIWGYLEAKACEKPHNSVTTLKKAIRKAWNEMPQDLVQRVVDAFPGRLQACIDAGGGHFE
uniref:Transposase n=1 Tax=Acrobeloides nanus TaxID=290746 RepID=A0A914DXS1_9BILA